MTFDPGTLYTTVCQIGIRLLVSQHFDPTGSFRSFRIFNSGTAPWYMGSSMSIGLAIVEVQDFRGRRA